MVAASALSRAAVGFAQAPVANGAAAGSGQLIKDPRLIIHTQDPPVFETPAALLAERQVTPASLLFVRNCQKTPASSMQAGALANWQLELAGLIDRPRTIAADMLKTLPRTEVEMVVQCSGNSRTLFSAAAPVKGTPWGRGGMGNVRFAGVRLSTVLEHFKVKIEPGARFISGEGDDAPAAGEMDFEHSLPLADVLERSLLALELNGEALPAVHGGPLRLVTPGYYGTMHIKWLRRLRFDAEESRHTSQIPQYRTPLTPIKPGERFEPTLSNSESNWRMKLKSVVLQPAAGAQLPVGTALIEGVAFNDGASRIDSVLVSIDQGNTWRPAKLEQPESPYAWVRFQAREPLSAGKQQVWVRAIDALGRSQPLDGSVHWNPQGYTWNGVEKIDVTVG